LVDHPVPAFQLRVARQKNGRVNPQADRDLIDRPEGWDWLLADERVERGPRNAGYRRELIVGHLQEVVDEIEICAEHLGLLFADGLEGAFPLLGVFKRGPAAELSGLGGRLLEGVNAALNEVPEGLQEALAAGGPGPVVGAAYLPEFLVGELLGGVGADARDTVLLNEILPVGGKL
jgi:hypothetical protein